MSSFGYSGTIVTAVLHEHAVLELLSPWHCLRLGEPSSGTLPMHPMLQQQLPHSDGTRVFRSPAVGLLSALLADHVVKDRVLFPGAGYLEVAHAACRAASKRTEAATLRGVFFMMPLVLADPNAPQLHMECVLQGNRGSFEVRSSEHRQTIVNRQ